MRVIEGFMMLFYMIFAILLFFDVAMSYNIHEGIEQLNDKIETLNEIVSRRNI